MESGVNKRQEVVFQLSLKDQNSAGYVVASGQSVSLISQNQTASVGLLRLC